MTSPRRTSRFGSGLVRAALLLALAAPAAAQSDVVLVAADTPGSALDVQAKLQASGAFGLVDIIDAGAGTPALLDLQAYGAVLTWSNFSYNDPVALGDVLADYAAGGGGVVVAGFATSEMHPGHYLQGKWIADGWEIIPSQGGNLRGSASLGEIIAPANMILSGVTSFEGGFLSARPAAAAPAGTIVEWSDGAPLAALSATQDNRVDLGFYPVSNAVAWTLWNQQTDGGLLLANALRYAAGERPFTLGPPRPGTVGVSNTLRYTNATPDGNVFLFRGFDPGATPVPGCAGLDLGIMNAVQVRMGMASSTGTGAFSGPVPPRLAGMTVLLQAADTSSCVVSNLIAHTFE